MTEHEATNLALSLMVQHGLDYWKFEFDRAKRRAGCCHYSTKTITLSRYYIVHNTYEEIKDTILHEVAHAICGSGVGHGPVWKQVCIRIGAKPKRCYDNTVVMPTGRWQAKCKNCAKEFRKHRKPRNLYGRYCVRCGPHLGMLAFRLVEETHACA